MSKPNRGLGSCNAEKAAMLKALLAKGTSQDVSARLIGVNSGRANDVLHGRMFCEVPPANDNELRAYLIAEAEKFSRTALSV